MPERSSKRKARRDSPVNSLDEPESSSMRTENTPSLSDKDFTELSEKIEKSVSKRFKDTEVGQREILKMIENLTSKIDTLAERPPYNVRLDSCDEDAGNTGYRFRIVESSDSPQNHGQHNWVHWLIGWLDDFFELLNNSLIQWLVDWLIDWLIVWLINWLIE